MDAPTRLTAPAEYLSARETTELLDIKLQTLYAYVSRGLIRSAGRPGKKARMYLRADVERAHARALARSGHGAVAADAMNHGHAIIPTSITEITEQGPRYRGKAATELARMAAPFEAVAELLWTGRWDARIPCWSVTRPSAGFIAMIDTFGASLDRNPLLEVFGLAILQLGMRHRAGTKGLHSRDIHDEARQIIGVLVGCCGLVSAGGYMPLRRGERIADGLLRALGGEVNPENSDTMAALLALMADHELSPGTLSARVAASGGATLHGCIASALCASSGLNVAHVYEQTHDFLAGAGSKAAWLRQAEARHAQGKTIPGFGHPLYPAGDPRARMLMEFIRARRPTRQLLAVCDFIDEVERTTGLHARHEMPIVALTRAMGLPKQAPSAIFLLSRTAGWVAHVQEQRLAGQLLRPRARFVGVPVLPAGLIE